MHESNTLGQRIQEGRKAAGLSQEALGERLDVSRQAVSKWESDAAIPELEKLIAISRIFGVSVDRLLGVAPAEDPAEVLAEDPTEVPAAPGELTEKELAAVEAIAARYAAEAQQHQRPQWSKKRKLLTGALAAALVLAAGLGVKRQLDAFDRRFAQLQQQVDGIQSSVAGEINSLTWQISNILDEKNNILANSQALVTAFDPDAQTVTLRLTASPKEWTDATTAVFTAALSDGRQFTAEAEGQGGSFTAEGFTVPMDHAIQLSVALTDGGSTRTEAMETLYDCLPGNFSLRINGDWNASWTSTSRRVSWSDLNLHIESRATPAYPLSLVPETVDLCLYRNRETEPEQVLPVPEAVDLFRECGYTQMLNMVDYQTSLELEEGDTVVAALRVTDSSGQTFWTMLNAFSCANGKTSYLNVPSFTEDNWTPGTAIH